MSDYRRFLSKVEHLDGHWIWQHGTGGRGYGHFKVNGETVTAHRYSYEYNNGAIPEGARVFVSCGMKFCVNPAHLSLRRNAHPVSKDACCHGHQMTDANTFVASTGQVMCRECNRRRSREYYHRKRATERGSRDG